MLEAFLLQKQEQPQEAIALLSDPSLITQQPAQVHFRLGRSYDQLGETLQAQEHYNKALEYNSNMDDARLCILNHLILMNPESAKKDIGLLERKLKGKRKAILFNIKARLIGYVDGDLDNAIKLLDNVSVELRDKQWYAVKIQLTQQMIELYTSKHYQKLTSMMQEKLNTIKDEYEKRFNETYTNRDITLSDSL